MANPARAMSQLYRQLQMLRCIPRFPRRISATELHQELQAQGASIDKRTVERDLKKLSALFPLDADGNKPQGWYWTKAGGALEIPTMSGHAAITMQLVRLHLEQALPRASWEHLTPYFARADEVVETMTGKGLRRWSDRVRFQSKLISLLPPDIDSDIMDAVYSALSTGKMLEGVYRGRNDDMGKAVALNPLGLVIRDQVVYLVCTYSGYEDSRHLPLHRFERAVASQENAATSDKFDLDALVVSGEFSILRAQETIAIRCNVDAVVARTLSETRMSKDQVLRKVTDDRFELSATVANTEMLRGWILSYGARIAVKEPQELREEIRTSLETTLHRYFDT